MYGIRRANVARSYVESSSEDESVALSSIRQDSLSPTSMDVSDDFRPNPKSRRGRGPSKHPCLNKNALMARENRQRKKEYLEGIESKLRFYQRENRTLTDVVQKQGGDIKRLSAEVRYLKSILNNNSSITTLLTAMNASLGKVANNRRVAVNGLAAEPMDEVESSRSRTSSTTMVNYFSEDESTDEGKDDNCNVFLSQASRGKVMPVYNNGKRECEFDFDHTYTMPAFKYAAVDGARSQLPMPLVKKEEADDEPLQKVEQLIMEGQDATSLGLPVSPVSMSHSEEDNFDLDIEKDLPDLPSFNPELFDKIGDLQDFDFFCNQDGDSLKNSGICLHVNAGKISLEYCSICHMNSLNATME